MHGCASILDSSAKGTSCSHHFSHGASIVSFEQVFALVPQIFAATSTPTLELHHDPVLIQCSLDQTELTLILC